MKTKLYKSTITFEDRQYMNSNDFEIFYYNDKKLLNFGVHKHDNYEIYLYLSGDIQYQVDGKEINLQKGDFFIIPPNVEHGPVKINEETNYKRFVIWLKKDFIESLSKIIPEISYTFNYIEKNKKYNYTMEYIHFNELFGSLLAIWREHTDNNPFKNSMEISLLSTFLIKVNRLIYDYANPIHSQTNTELYTLIFDYINRNITENLTLENIANQFYTSKYHISHMFKENLGISPYQYITKLKLDNCRNAIAAGEPITNVAQKFGFVDYTTFYRAFKKEYGMSPKEYKELHT